MNRRLISLMIACALAVTVAGCASRPTSAFVRRGPTYNAIKPAVDRVGLLVDATVAYDRVSTNYFDIEDSMVAISNLVHEAQAALNAKGYEVVCVQAPFVGGFKPADKSFRVAQARKDAPADRFAPFFVDAAMDSDPEYRDALLKTSRDVMAAVADRGELPTEVLCSSPGTRTAFSTVASKMGVRYLLVVQGSGTIVSAGEQTGQAIGTALLSTAVSLGSVTVTVHNVSLLDNHVSLIDLQTPEAVWCNSLRLAGLNPANPSDYKSRWAEKVLYWLPPRGQLEVPLK